MSHDEIKKNIKKRVQQDKVKELTKYNKQLEAALLAKEKEMGLVLEFEKFKPTYEIRQTKNGGKLSATAFIVFSDWHVDEFVDPRSVNFLNEFNPDIAESRINFAFNNAIRLVKIAKNDVTIDQVVVCMLGDFLSNCIHEELLQNSSMQPSHAILWLCDKMTAGLRMLKENFDNMIVVCHSGNHGRNTKKIFHATFEGNSSERMLYGFLERLLPEIDFRIATGYHSYIDCYGKFIRMSHGYNIKYFGGIGNIFPSAYKSINLWNKGKNAALDIWGHFHSTKNGQIFIQNGSLIGWNAFANSIKADFQIPLQQFFIFLSNGLVSMNCPIILEKV